MRQRWPSLPRCLCCLSSAHASMMSTLIFSIMYAQPLFIGVVLSRFLGCPQADPSHAHAWQAWGVMECRAGNHSVARTLWESGLKNCPRHGPLWQVNNEDTGNRALFLDRLFTLFFCEGGRILFVILGEISWYFVCFFSTLFSSFFLFFCVFFAHFLASFASILVRKRDERVNQTWTPRTRLQVCFFFRRFWAP